MLKNALVLMFDSLQRSYIGCYGNTWIKTPNMDRLAREGVQFMHSFTEGVPTVPCRRAMHTGRFTLQKAGWVALTMEDTTIADLCWGRPIDTAIVFDCPMYRLPKFGYTRGFDKVWFTHGHEADDQFYEHDPLLHLKKENYVDETSKAAYIKKCGPQVTAGLDIELENYLKQRQYGGDKEENRYVARTINKAIEYLEQTDKNKQFFLWIDSFDPHEPWDPPSVYADYPCPYDPNYTGKDEFCPFPELVEGIYTEPQLNHVRMLYAELVTLCDKYLGKLMEAMRRLGLEENTLFMMVSDHGEPLGNAEHGHGLMRKERPWPYQELVHTPLLLRCPGIKAGQKIDAFVQSCDIAPTVCDWLGIGVHPDMQGKSLLPVCRGETHTVHEFAIAGYQGYSWAIYTKEWSFIHWVKSEKNDLAMGSEFYGSSVDRSHLEAIGTTSLFDTGDAMMKQALSNDTEGRYKDMASIDGEAQWTCTPGTKVEVPETDELYYTPDDFHQLNNVISKHPEKAAELFALLRDKMAALQAS